MSVQRTTNAEGSRPRQTWDDQPKGQRATSKVSSNAKPLAQPVMDTGTWSRLTLGRIQPQAGPDHGHGECPATGTGSARPRSRAAPTTGTGSTRPWARAASDHGHGHGQPQARATPTTGTGSTRPRVRAGRKQPPQRVQLLDGQRAQRSTRPLCSLKSPLATAPSPTGNGQQARGRQRASPFQEDWTAPATGTGNRSARQQAIPDHGHGLQPATGTDCNRPRARAAPTTGTGTGNAGHGHGQHRPQAWATGKGASQYPLPVARAHGWCCLCPWSALPMPVVRFRPCPWPVLPLPVVGSCPCQRSVLDC